jgi:hypothetical protein
MQHRGCTGNISFSGYGQKIVEYTKFHGISSRFFQMAAGCSDDSGATIWRTCCSHSDKSGMLCSIVPFPATSKVTVIGHRISEPGISEAMSSMTCPGHPPLVTKGITILPWKSCPVRKVRIAGAIVYHQVGVPSITVPISSQRISAGCNGGQ